MTLPPLTHTTGQIPVARRSSSIGSVVSARDSSVRAGDEIFALGGNAVDAAVAAALVAGVIEPTETTLAGSGFMLVHRPGHDPVSIEFGPLAPGNASADMFDIENTRAPSNVLGLAPVVDNANVTGPRASGVPRTLYALLEAQERYGLLTPEQVLAPAIRAAEEGFAADTWFVTNAMQDLELLARDPGCAATFLDNDGLPIGRRSGVAYGTSIDIPPRVRQPVLASTLRRVSQAGHRDLLDGGTAALLAETFAEYGMALTPDDLRRIPPRVETPALTEVNGMTVCTPRAPGGGRTVQQALKVWQRVLDAAESSLPRREEILLLSRVLRHVFADRYHWLGDDEQVDVPLDALLSDEYATHLANLVRTKPWDGTDVGAAPWNTFADRALHDPRAVTSGEPGPAWGSGGAHEPTTGTTHISAADADGLIATITHTAANHFGSAVICPRTGLLFDSTMAWFNALPGAANSITPGGRPVANMAPALVIDPATGRSWALGASGGRRIVSAIVQLIAGIAIDRIDGTGVLARPRIDASGAPVVLHESEAVLAAGLEELQAHIVPQQSLSFELDFARANIAEYTPGGGVVTSIEARAYGT